MRALVKDIVTELIDICACAHVSDVWQLQACAVLDTAQLRVFKLFLQPVTKFFFSKLYFNTGLYLLF